MGSQRHLNLPYSSKTLKKYQRSQRNKDPKQAAKEGDFPSLAQNPPENLWGWLAAFYTQSANPKLKSSKQDHTAAFIFTVPVESSTG